MQYGFCFDEEEKWGFCSRSCQADKHKKKDEFVQLEINSIQHCGAQKLLENHEELCVGGLLPQTYTAHFDRSKENHLTFQKYQAEQVPQT